MTYQHLMKLPFELIKCPEYVFIVFLTGCWLLFRYHVVLCETDDISVMGTSQFEGLKIYYFMT